MDQKTLTQQTGQARGDLKRLERDMGRVKKELNDGTRNSIVGGVLLMIGVLALIMFFTGGSNFVIVIAIGGLLVGGIMLVRALLKSAQARRTMSTMTDGVDKAQAKLTELETPPHQEV